MLPLIVYRKPIRRRVRLARREDEEVVTEIANYAFAPKDRTTWIHGAFGRSDRTIYVLEDCGHVEGFVITREEGPHLRIDLIGTRKPRTGICRDLMKAVEFMSPYDMTEVVAGTHSDNDTAKLFYGALGFT